MHRPSNSIIVIAIAALGAIAFMAKTSGSPRFAAAEQEAPLISAAQLGDEPPFIASTFDDEHLR